ncbi:MAG: ABC transporter permease [Gammaproteobacteria bacterium]
MVPARAQAKALVPNGFNVGLRLAPWLMLLVLIAPIALGVGLTVLPAFGYMPVLGGEHFTLRHFSELLAAPGLGHSVTVSAMSALLTPLLALVLVFLFLAAATGTRIERWMRRLVAPLLAIPHAAAAFGLAFLIAPSGLLLRWASPELSGFTSPPDALIVNDYWGLSLILALTVKEIPFLLLMALAALPQIEADKRVSIARSLGYKPALAWLLTVAPVLYPLIRLPVYAVIAFASATVDVALIIGPNLPYTLSVLVLQWFNDPDLNYRFVAAAGALLQLGVTLGALLVWRGLEVAVAALGRCYVLNGHRSRGDTTLRITGFFGVGLAVLLSLGGIIALALNSIAGFWRFPENLPRAWSFRAWDNAFLDLAVPLSNTLLIGLLSTAVAIVLVLAVLEGEQRSGKRHSPSLLLLYLPLIIPQIAFLFGLIVATEYMRWAPNIGMVTFAHLLFVLPYSFLSLSEAYRRLDPRWSQLAATLGASQWRCFWKVRLPLLLAPCLTAIAVGLAVSVSQYLATQLIGAGRIPTITTEAVALASGGNRSIIAVWALLQALLPMAGFLLALFLPRLLWRNRRGMRGIA